MRDADALRRAQQASTEAKCSVFVTLTCVVCGEMFTTTGDRRSAQTCGPECKKVVRAEYRRQEHARNRERYREYKRQAGSTAKGREGIMRRAARRAERLRAERPPRPDRILVCPQCGVQFPIKRAGNKKYCSPDCAREMHKRTERLRERTRYQNDEAYRTRLRAKSREWGESNRAKAVAKAKRNKIAAKDRDPVRYAELASKYVRESAARIKQEQPNKHAERIRARGESKWRRKWMKIFNGDIPPHVLELLSAQRELTRDLQNASPKWRDYLNRQPYVKLRHGAPPHYG